MMNYNPYDEIRSQLEQLKKNSERTLFPIKNYHYEKNTNLGNGEYRASFYKNQIYIEYKDLIGLFLGVKDCEVGLQSRLRSKILSQNAPIIKERIFAVQGHCSAPISSGLSVLLPDWMHPNLLENLPANLEFHHFIRSIASYGYNQLLFGELQTNTRVRFLEEKVDLSPIVNVCKQYGIRPIFKLKLLSTRRDFESYQKQIETAFQDLENIPETILWEGFNTFHPSFYTEDSRLAFCVEEVNFIHSFLKEEGRLIYMTPTLNLDDEVQSLEWLPDLQVSIASKARLAFQAISSAQKPQLHSLSEWLIAKQKLSAHHLIPIVNLESLEGQSSLLTELYSQINYYQFPAVIATRNLDMHLLKQHAKFLWTFGHGLYQALPILFLENAVKKVQSLSQALTA